MMIGGMAGPAGATLVMHSRKPDLLPAMLRDDWDHVRVYCWAVISMWVFWFAYLMY